MAVTLNPADIKPAPGSNVGVVSVSGAVIANDEVPLLVDFSVTA